VAERDDALRRLIDKDAIRDLVLSYSRAVDRQDFACLRTLYTADAMEDDHNGLYAGPAAGYVDWLETVMPRLGITAHAVQNHLIAIEDDGHAQGEVYVTSYHRMPPAEDGTRQDLINGARYLDHYRKEEGLWKFARRTVTLDWKRIAPSSWDPLIDDLQGGTAGTHDAGDPSYQVLCHRIFARQDR
jgi:ketosteroid isomerase-like protein